MYNSFLKRSIDILLSLLALILLTPVMIIVAILIYIKLGQPVFFRQQRPGKDGKIFTMYKFRTMLNGIDKNGCDLPDALRLTRFGKFLRGTSLDELPELINVLKGDMSLVGPRPLLVEYLGRYTPEQARRHEIRPGITGWAQINGRNSISWEDKFKLDVWYVDNLSLWLDIKIILLTVVKVFIRDGISQTDHVTVDKFKGYNNGVGM